METCVRIRRFGTTYGCDWQIGGAPVGFGVCRVRKRVPDVGESALGQLLTRLAKLNFSDESVFSLCLLNSLLIANVHLLINKYRDFKK